MHGKPVLVVDNDASTVELVTEALKPYGYSVVSASSGSDGLRMARERKPALIFINLSVPGTDGLKICKTFMSTESVKDIPLILLTMREGKYDPRYKAQYGIVDFLRKPIDPMELVARTRQFAPPVGGQEVVEAAAAAEEAEALEVAEEETPEPEGFEAALASLDEIEETLTPIEEAEEAVEVIEAVDALEVEPGEEVFEAEEAVTAEPIEEGGGMREVRDSAWSIPEEEPLEEPAGAQAAGAEEEPDWALPEEEPLEPVEEGAAEAGEWALPEEEGELEGLLQAEEEPDWSIPEEEPAVLPDDEPPALAGAEDEPDWALPEEEPLEISEEQLSAELEDEGHEPAFTEAGEAGIAGAREESASHEDEGPDWPIPEEEPLEEPAGAQAAGAEEEPDWALPEEEPLTSIEEMLQEEPGPLEKMAGEDFSLPEQDKAPPALQEEPAAPLAEKEPEYAAVRATALEALKRKRGRPKLVGALMAILVVVAAALLYVFAISSEHKAPPPRSPAPEKAVTEAREPEPEEPEAAEAEVAPQVKTARAAPQKPAAEARKPAAFTPERVYYVQFGAFRSKDNAERLVRKLRDMEYDTFISRNTLKGEPIYLVLLSTKFTDKWNAFKQAKHIKDTSDLSTSVHIAKP